MKQIVLISVLFLLVCQTSEAIAEKHALLIGIENYEGSGLKSLQGPGNDLKIIKRVLQERYGFKKYNINVLMNKQATHTGIEKAFYRLAEKIISGDFVYIHYSGHGSRTPDLNGDERSGYDQTWVSFSSRVAGKKGKDAYDILDDEMNEWLFAVFNKTEHVIFVSDSCHSSSMARGKPPAARAGSVDKRIHPLGKNKFKLWEFKTGIRIGASRDSESAAEFSFEDGKNYGLFSWHWAKALKQAWPGETWGDLFQRTFTMVTTRRPSQQPQLQGMGNLTVFGEANQKRCISSSDESPRVRVTVSRVFDDGKNAQIEAGFLSNVTTGSMFRLFNPAETDTDILPSISITEVNPFYSIGKIDGSIKMGDLVVEEEHAYEMKPLRVFINADEPEGEDRKSIKMIRSIFISDALPEYEVTNSQDGCMFVLYVLRPKKKNKKYIKKKPEDTLPQSFPGHPPEVWILTDIEALLHENLRIPLKNYGEGLRILKRNLKKIARIHEIKKFSSPRVPRFDLKTTVWKPVASCDKVSNDCLVLPDDKTFFKKQGIYNCEEMESQGRNKRLELNTLLTFLLKNNSERTFYAYIINAMANGEIKPIFPTIYDRREDAEVQPGEERDFMSFTALSLDEPGVELIKLIVTERPINIALLYQSGFEKRKPTNPLEWLLTNAVHGKRGSTVNMRVEGWGTMQYSFTVDTSH